MERRPNVLFIISDQHNAKVLGHKGHPDVKTPNLDRLAAEGVRFDNAITQNPISTPSRISFLSGQYPHNHGYHGLSGPRPDGLPTILGHFRRAGYRTAAIGKIHCPEYWVEDDADFYRETCDGCSIGGAKEYNAYLAEKGVREDHSSLFEFGPRGRQTCDARASVMRYEDSMEGWAVRQAMNFISSVKEEGKPFFVLVSLPKPHQCYGYAPSEPFWSLYDESRLTLPPNADYDMAAAQKAPHLRRTAEWWRRGDWTLFEPRTFEAGRLRKLHGYLGCVSHVDHAVGELLNWLEENGLEEDTIVIYTSDHGDYACEHGIMEKAPGICSDAITRIPFIWRCPGRFKAGHVATEIVEAVDLPTTLSSLAGLEPLETSDGKDLTHLLRGEKGDLHRIGVTEFAWSKSVRKGKYRYVYYPPEMFPEEYPDGFGELYDLERDPWEMENLYFKPEYADVVRELRDDLLDWLITTTRPRTVLGVGVFGGGQAITRYHCTVNPDGKIHPDRLRRMRNRNYL
jgi:arylsulfatase A-like enzyme